MKEKLIKLVNVKSIVTLVLTCVFSYLCITKTVDSMQFITIFTMIISFYFGIQKGEKDNEK